MKTIRIFPLIALLMAISSFAFAQTKTETFKVSGNCGMCKNKIEKAAKDAGATTAVWNVEKKELTVTYTSSSTNTAKIQQKIADVGYDNAGFTATAESYDKLHACCKYERTTSQTSEAKLPGWMGGSDKEKKTCAEGKECCKKDGKMECSKDSHEGKDCCKDGKCTKEGHDGKDCCKKSE